MKTTNNNPMNTNSNLNTNDMSNPQNMPTDPNSNPGQVQEQTNTAASMQKQHQDVDNGYQEAMGKEWGLVEQIGNRSMYKEVVKNRKALFNASAEYRIQFYRTVLDGRLAALQEKTTTGLMMIEAHYREQVSDFIGEKMISLKAKIQDKRERLFEMMKGQHDYIKNLEGYPDLQATYKNSILNEAEGSMKFLEGLAVRFEKVLMDKISGHNK